MRAKEGRPVTIKEIAKLCGVSRGTVDRVLNDRGKVKPETRELILRTISDLAEHQANVSFDELERYVGQLAEDITVALLERLKNA